MTLTVCVGSSGSGKTTFLNDVHKSHNCTYIRQFHAMRPYIPVVRIPNFDPTQLPYWNVYVDEGKDTTILTGGMLNAKFVPGLSGGQRKLLLFELIYQRTREHQDLLIVLDEPFAGVTDDFVPFVVGRLNQLRQLHNILLVTNDHVDTLTEMADNTIRVSAIDRSVVQVNEREGVNREKAILALSVGDEYQYKATKGDLQFFFDVEIRGNGFLVAIMIFAIFAFSLFIATFWNSDTRSAALVLIASGLIAFFCVNPYIVAMVQWRDSMVEEAEALMHASARLNKILKAFLTIFLVFIVASVEFGVVNIVIDGLESVHFWVAMLVDVLSIISPMILLGLYTRLNFAAVQLLGASPFLLMIFCSTTYSPGAGLPVMKELRYLFPRFYFWCMVPVVSLSMEDCPPDGINTFYLILSGFLFTFFFVTYKLCLAVWRSSRQLKVMTRRASMIDAEYREIQHILYGPKEDRPTAASAERTAPAESSLMSTKPSPTLDIDDGGADDAGVTNTTTTTTMQVQRGLSRSPSKTSSSSRSSSSNLSSNSQSIFIELQKQQKRKEKQQQQLAMMRSSTAPLIHDGSSSSAANRASSSSPPAADVAAGVAMARSSTTPPSTATMTTTTTTTTTIMKTTQTVAEGGDSDEENPQQPNPSLQPLLAQNGSSTTPLLAQPQHVVEGGGGANSSNSLNNRHNGDGKDEDDNNNNNSMGRTVSTDSENLVLSTYQDCGSGMLDYMNNCGTA